MCNYIQCEGGAQIGKPWLKAPVTCNFCKVEEPDCFVDGQLTLSAAWAIMCIKCFKIHGAGIGLNIGQKYCKKQ